MTAYSIFGRDYSDRYDAIIIGAGIGGLVCANLLARAGLKVLLLERHYMLGGYCSTFRRHGFVFDAATHFYPLLGNPQTFTGALLRNLGVTTRWIKMDPVDQFHVPGLPPFSVPADFDAYIAKLRSCFPHEAASIDGFFAETRQAYLHGLLHFFRGKESAHAARWKNVTVSQKLDEWFHDARLKTILMADSAHWGSPANRTSYLFDAILRLAYFLGNYYPQGSSQAFADDLGRCLVAAGGKILRCAEALQILVREGKAGGVRIRTCSRRPPQEFQFHAPIVVSNADARHTYRELLGERYCGSNELAGLETLAPTAPCFLVHLGLRGMDPERLAAVAGYHWRSHDPEDVLRDVFKIFVPTQYDESVAPPGCQILIVQKLTPIVWNEVSDWHEHRRKIHEQIMRRLRHLLPELDRHIVVNLAASAWTSHFFTNNFQGAMLGWEMSPGQLGNARLPQETPVENVYLTGHWTQPGGGVTPVIVSGQQVADRILATERVPAAGSDGLGPVAPAANVAKVSA
jgi:phytoene dehydrogenase-like protein